MSEEEITPEESGSKPAAKVRRISNPRPRKKAKKVVETESAAAEEASTPIEVIPEQAKDDAEEASPAKVADPVPVAGDSSSDMDAVENPATISEESIAAISAGSASPSGEGKRKRRRRKGKGSNTQHEEGATSGEAVADGQGAANPPNRNPQNSRPQLDPDVVAVKAWKIFLAEVSEEGVALINDQDARDLARRCFRLSEIFLEERARRRRD